MARWRVGGELGGAVSDRSTILVTGATGYIGRRLVPKLQARGDAVRCLVRRPSGRGASFGPDVDVVTGDALDTDSLAPALEGVAAAYYLIHSMGRRGDFEEWDRRAARNFAAAARRCGLRRLIYLGGLAQGDRLSPHLASRHEVGRILRASGVPTVEFQASVIIGAGSLSFEMIRALVDRLPVMITPRWVRTLAQPIGIDDVLAYLVAGLDVDVADSEVFEIGGADQASYRDIMMEYARQRGRRRLMLPVPVLTPRLSSYWLGLVTPLYARIGRKLIEGVRNPSIVRDDRALDVFDIRPLSLEQQIAAALSVAPTGGNRSERPYGEPLDR